jgi:hypothetical protein
VVAFAALGVGALGVGPASGADPVDDIHRALPADLVPSLRDATRIRPRAYSDGCHARPGEVKARACAYGVKGATRTVLLFGDSHALQWLPTLEAIAEQEGWKVYSLTKSACPVPRVEVTVRGADLRDCTRWRKAAFKVIERLHPDLVVAASLGRIYRIPGATKPRNSTHAWHDGWVSSLRTLRSDAGHVVLLGDTPMWHQDAVACLRAHRRDIAPCDTPLDEATSSRVTDTEREAAADAGVPFVPTTDLVCPTDPCRAVQGRDLVLLDDQHMTVAWARSVADQLLARLPCDVIPGAAAGEPAAASTAPGSPAASAPLPAASGPPQAAGLGSPQASGPPSASAAQPLVSASPAASEPVASGAPVTSDGSVSCVGASPPPGTPSCACS